VPRPKFDLAVEAEAKSDKFEAFATLASNCV